MKYLTSKNRLILVITVHLKVCIVQHIDIFYPNLSEVKW